MRTISAYPEPMVVPPRLSWLVVVLTPAVASATAPPIIHDNPHTYPLGGRAAAMGGAYTALACDEASVHYNPAGLACARSSRLELSANAYVLQNVSIPDALGVGEDISATNYHSLPAIVGGARILSEGDATTGVGRWAWGLSVTMPHSLSLRVAPRDPTRANALTFAGRDTVISGDLGMGYQLTPWLAVGASLGGAVRSFEAHVNELLAADADECAQDVCTPFFAASTELDALGVGLRGKLGVRVTPTPELSFGLVVVSPSVHVLGSYSQSETVTFSIAGPDDQGSVRTFYGPIVSRLKGTSELGLAGHVTLGVAWSTPSLTLSADARLYFPRSIGLATALESLPVQGQEPSMAPPDAELTRRVHPNFNVGAAYALNEDVALAAGVYTDLSAVADVDFDAGTADRVNAFGLTAAVGLLGEQTRAWFGVAAAIGFGEAHVPSGERRLETVILEGLDEDRVTSMTRWTVAAFIGSSYSFEGD